ncbi:proteoglycan 4-like [Girardinichthys multiradiatus]|uniref:proteoglycan 4-like n=1 Tax=Girardinichthys multiradiatus TaxID=208333 RepID=UPI001FADB085|nr:proteoglycan 4-like [Girardinichthys multiradiatus]
MPQIPSPQGRIPTDELHPQKAYKDTSTQRKLHTQPHSKHTQPVLPPTTQYTVMARQGPRASPPKLMPTKDTSPPLHTLQPLHAALQPAVLIPPPLRHDSQRSSTPPSPPNHSANHPCASTTRKPPQCRYKKCCTAPPTQPRPQPSASTGGRATEGSIGKRPPEHAKDQAPHQPHTSTPEVPQHAGCTLPHSISHHTKQVGQPLHQSEATSLSPPYTVRPRPPRRSLVPELQKGDAACTSLPECFPTLPPGSDKDISSDPVYNTFHTSSSDQYWLAAS